jgi:hypothetical protein
MIDIRAAVAHDLLQSYAPPSGGDLAAALEEAAASAQRTPTAYLQYIFSRPPSILNEIDALVRRRLEDRLRFYTYLSLAYAGGLVPSLGTTPIAERIQTDFDNPVLGRFLKRHPLPGLLFEPDEDQVSEAPLNERTLSLFWHFLDVNKGSEDSPEFELAFDLLRYGQADGITLDVVVRRVLRGPRKSKSKSLRSYFAIVDGLMDVLEMIQETHRITVDGQSAPRLYRVLLLRHLYLLGSDTVARLNFETLVASCLAAYENRRETASVDRLAQAAFAARQSLEDLDRRCESLHLNVHANQLTPVEVTAPRGVKVVPSRGKVTVGRRPDEVWVEVVGRSEAGYMVKDPRGRTYVAPVAKTVEKSQYQGLKRGVKVAVALAATGVVISKVRKNPIAKSAD